MATKKKKKASSSSPRKAKTTKRKAAAPKKTQTKKKKVLAAKTKSKAKTKAKTKAKKKPAPKKASAKKAASTTTARRDNAGHLDPQYERDLQERVQEKRRSRDDETAFLSKSRAHDDLAEELGEEAVMTMTSGEDQSERWEAEVEEERGGPFVNTGGREELAGGTDESNPQDATREPFPTT